MFIHSAVGDVFIGDIIIQLLFFFIIIAFAAAVIWGILGVKKQHRRLTRIEEKLDQLLADNKKDKI